MSFFRKNLAPKPAVESVITQLEEDFRAAMSDATSYRAMAQNYADRAAAKELSAEGLRVAIAKLKTPQEPAT